MVLAVSIIGSGVLTRTYVLDVKWEDTIGGDSEDYLRAIQTIDDGYVAAGGTRSSGMGKSDILLIKTDRNGRLVWNKTYGSPGSEYARGLIVVDDGYVIVGDKKSLTTYWDIYLMKTDLDGNFLWSRTYGGDSGDAGRSVQQTLDGGYIIGGETESFTASKDIYLIKTDSKGRIQWEKNFGGPDYDRTRSLIVDSDGNYVLTGKTSSIGAGGYDALLMKVTPRGKMLWMKAFGGAAPDWGYCVKEAVDGGYIIAGKTKTWSCDHFTDVYVIKTDKNGDLEWENAYGGDLTDLAYSVNVLDNGEYLVAGNSNSYTEYSDNDVLLIRINSRGRLVWNITYGSEISEEIYCMTSNRHEYVLAGNTCVTDDTTKDAYIIKIREYTSINNIPIELP